MKQYYVLSIGTYIQPKNKNIEWKFAHQPKGTNHLRAGEMGVGKWARKLTLYL